MNSYVALAMMRPLPSMFVYVDQDNGSCASNETEAFSGGADEDVEQPDLSNLDEAEDIRQEEILKLVKKGIDAEINKRISAGTLKKVKAKKVKVEKSPCENAKEKSPCERAKAKPIIKCTITDLKQKTLSSFKFSKADITTGILIRFLDKDGIYIEYCPKYCCYTTQSISDFLSNTNFQEKGSWSQRTKKLPDNWGFKEGRDYIRYKTDADRVAHKKIIKTWAKTKNNDTNFRSIS
jgi:hypothetical protein